MEFTHHGLLISLSDDWWADAGMADFVPSAAVYSTDRSAFPGIFEVKIDDIGPVHRNPGVGVFNDDHYSGIPARERVVRILRGFRCGDLIPPVAVLKVQTGGDFSYRLSDGTHRLYYALAAGFSHVPAIWGLDINALDR